MAVRGSGGDEKDEARTQQCRMMRICGDNCVGDDGKSDNGAQWQKVWDEDGVSRLCKKKYRLGTVTKAGVQ